jgi:hypothetical protein
MFNFISYYFSSKDEIVKLKAGFTLDMNLEKNKTTEMVRKFFDMNNYIYELC